MDYICSAIELPTPVKVAARAHGGFRYILSPGASCKMFQKKYVVFDRAISCSLPLHLSPTGRDINQRYLN